MTFIAPEHPPAQAPTAAGEREMLQGWLDEHRRILLRKCGGLTEEQLRLRAVEPSSLSLLGLVRHMAEVERWWFRRQVSGVPLEDIYCSETNVDGDFDDVDGADAAADFATFVEEIRLADEAVRARSLEDTFVSKRGRTMNLRWVYVHMIEEYARHNGHADFLRERIDGRTGS